MKKANGKPKTKIERVTLRIPPSMKAVVEIQRGFMSDSFGGAELPLNSAFLYLLQAAIDANPHLTPKSE